MIKEFSGDFLQWLRGFYCIAETGSVSEAAKKMRRTQSTVSYQLQCLEKELNIVLFDRINGRLCMTREGRLLLDKAISAFEIVNGMCADLSAAEGELKGFLNVDCIRPMALHFLSDALVTFCTEHPKVNVQVSVLQPSKIISNVERVAVDFGITALKSDLTTCTLDTLFVSKPVLVGPVEHRYDLGPKARLEDFCGLPLVVMVQDQIDLFTAPGFTLEQLEFLDMSVVAQVSLPQMILNLVSKGLGFAVMDEFSLWANAKDKLRFRVYDLCAPLPPIAFGILVRKHKYLSPQAKRLIELFKERLAAKITYSGNTAQDVPIFRYLPNI